MLYSHILSINPDIFPHFVLEGLPGQVCVPVLALLEVAEDLICHLADTTIS